MKVLECVDSNGAPSNACDTSDIQSQLTLPTELCETTECFTASSYDSKWIYVYMCKPVYVYVSMHAYMCMFACIHTSKQVYHGIVSFGTDQSADVTSLEFAVPLTAVLCSLLSGAITALATFCYFHRRKKIRKCGGRMKGQAERNPPV